MIRKQNKNGLTLIELLAAIAIVAILAAGLYIAGSRAETQAKIKLTESTIQMLSTALEQYRDFYGKFPFKADLTYNRVKLEGADSNGLNGTVTVSTGVPADYNDHYASDDALYYYLNRNPASKKIIGSINSSLITNKDDRKREYFITISGTTYPLLHFVDAWKSPFRYTYATGDNFPLIESAGPDKDFNKKDDNITSR